MFICVRVGVFMFVCTCVLARVTYRSVDFTSNYGRSHLHIHIHIHIHMPVVDRRDPPFPLGGSPFLICFDFTWREKEEPPQKNPSTGGCVFHGEFSRPKMNKSHLKRHEFLVSRTVK